MPSFPDSLANDFRTMLGGEFAEEALVRASPETVVRVRGIFDSTYLEIDPGTNATVASDKSRVTIFRKDVPFDIVQGTLVTVDGTAYRVRDIQPDGLGGASLYLDHAKPSETRDSADYTDGVLRANEDVAIDAARAAVENEQPNDASSLSGSGIRKESDAVALDDLLVKAGSGLFPSVETIAIADPLVAGAAAPAGDSQQVEPRYSGDFTYSGALDYGATLQPGIDKPMQMAIEDAGVLTEEELV